MKLGEIIRIYARFHKISDRQLAKEIGVSKATMSRLLNGSTTDIKTAVKLFNWLILTDAQESSSGGEQE